MPEIDPIPTCTEPSDAAEIVEIPETPQEHAPMLDIHDAHHAASTWREFFIHIATIVLGLVIAVSLEQTVEYFHHRSERRQLEDDLRAEAERRIPLETRHLKAFAIQADWDRETLERGRAAAASGGFVTFVLPDRPQSNFLPRPEDAAWPAAKASGLVAVLSSQEVEGWDRVDFYAQMAQRDNDDQLKASEDFRAVADRLGVSVAPGATVRVTPEERDELMRALALQYEKWRQFMSGAACWQAASDAAIHGELSVEQMQPYIERARAALPK
ncbi:MAG TPA: hypothetical protein VGU23_09820 [Acidobacteriaceae bacterium]|nr:hypothetical protein [Acidobacteriaceae bacterium]